MNEAMPLVASAVLARAMRAMILNEAIVIDMWNKMFLEVMF